VLQFQPIKTLGERLLEAALNEWNFNPRQKHLSKLIRGQGECLGKCFEFIKG
jgi:hypothetical protein